MEGVKKKRKKKKKKITPREQRMYFLIFSGICLAVAAYMILNAFQDNIVFFRTPTDLVSQQIPPGQNLRIGGLVKAGTLKDHGNGVYEFIITDTKNEVTVVYSGMMPSLFREGQGVVAYGSLTGEGNFNAKEILAKHDEKYMPPEVYKDLKEKGYQNSQ